MPSVVAHHDTASMVRWKRSPKSHKAYSTAQDSALGTRDEPLPRFLDHALKGKHGNAKDMSKVSSQSHLSRDESHGRIVGRGHTSNSRPSPQSPWERQREPNIVIATGKRKAGISVKPPPARRRKLEAKLELLDEAYIRSNFGLPSKADYPSLPDAILDTPKYVLHQKFQGVLRSHSVFTALSRDQTRCTVTSVLPGNERVEVVGDGTSKKAAENAAFLHLIAKFHESGFLKILFSSGPEFDQQTIQEERDAKLDIYNYSARYGCVPQISTRTVQNIRLHRRRRKTFDDTEVTVELPEQNIRVSGQGPNLATAEIAASIKFKQEAEKYHVEQGTDSLVIKDSTALNVHNARSFFDFFRIHNPGSHVDVKVGPLESFKATGRTVFEATILVGGTPTGTPVTMNSRKRAEDLAYLTGAIEITKRDPVLLTRFFKAPRSSTGDILKPLNPVDMPVDEDCVLLMRDTLLDARRLGLTDEQEELESERETTETRGGRYRPVLGRVAAEKRSIQLELAYQQYQQRSDLAELRMKRDELPMNQCQAKVLDIVNNNTYSIVIGATGSGKTTQVPQILLEQAIQNCKGAACNIVCTQPRRIAATSVARRVADERAEKLQETVGYHVRFDAKLPQVGGSITYCTTGILLQQLQHHPDEVLDATSHLIIDEVHERDMQIDFLLIILKKVMAERIKTGKSIPKVVLMSATMDAELFASYFKNAGSADHASSCPTLSVPGRTFPVKERHLEEILETLDKQYGSSKLGAMYSDVPTREYFEVEKSFAQNNRPKAEQHTQTGQQEAEESVIDWKRERVVSADGEVMRANEREEGLVPIALVATTIAHLAKTTPEGAILVFLPGLDEMVKVDGLLRNTGILGTDFKDESKYKMYMLHSSIAAGQTEVFDPVPPGCRKIILGTNIAETSITIPDVQHVVDTGKLREKRYDQLRRITKLQCTWISKSNSKQRAGRAGRVQNGNYYALFSKARYESFRAIGLPELLRSDLQETCLDVKAQAFRSPIREFLAEAIEPPAPTAVNSAVLSLQTLDALTDEEKLTDLGRLLASLPVHPALGKMIVLGVIFRCLDPMLLLGAAAEERNIFLNPLDARREAQAARLSFVQGSGSDHIAFLNAFRQMRHVRETQGMPKLWDFANRYYVHQGAFRSIDNTAKQIEQILVEAGLIPYTSPDKRLNLQYGDPSLNENSYKAHVVKALALAGLHPNLAAATGGPLFRTVGEKNALIHPSSVNAIRDKDRERAGHKYGTLYSYSTMAKSNDGRNILLRETSESTPLMASLFGGHLQTQQKSNRILQIDDWLSFYVKCNDQRAVKTIIEFRKAMERLLTGAFKDLSRKEFLAEDPVRRCFAEGLVEVLNRDVRLSERTMARGWGRDESGVEDIGYGDGGGRRSRNGEERRDHGRPQRGGSRWM